MTEGKGPYFLLSTFGTVTLILCKFEIIFTHGQSWPSLWYSPCVCGHHYVMVHLVIEDSSGNIDRQLVCSPTAQ